MSLVPAFALEPCCRHPGLALVLLSRTPVQQSSLVDPQGLLDLISVDSGSLLSGS